MKIKEPSRRSAGDFIQGRREGGKKKSSFSQGVSAAAGFRPRGCEGAPPRTGTPKKKRKKGWWGRWGGAHPGTTFVRRGGSRIAAPPTPPPAFPPVPPAVRPGEQCAAGPGPPGCAVPEKSCQAASWEAAAAATVCRPRRVRVSSPPPPECPRARGSLLPKLSRHLAPLSPAEGSGDGAGEGGGTRRGARRRSAARPAEQAEGAARRGAPRPPAAVPPRGPSPHRHTHTTHTPLRRLLPPERRGRLCPPHAGPGGAGPPRSVRPSSRRQESYFGRWVGAGVRRGAAGRRGAARRGCTHFSLAWLSDGTLLLLLPLPYMPAESSDCHAPVNPSQPPREQPRHHGDAATHTPHWTAGRAATPPGR